MLCLSRKVGEEIVIGDDIRVVVVSVKGNRVQVGITAPENVKVLRSEVCHQVSTQNLAVPDPRPVDAKA